MPLPIDLGSAIHTFKVKNFRSFRSFNIDLDRLNLFVGPNASGKSNLLSAIKFIRDIADDGLRDAISLQGGINVMPNVNHPDDQITFTISYSESGPSEGLQLLFEPVDAALPMPPSSPRYTYDLELRPLQGNRWRIDKEVINVHFACGPLPAEGPSVDYLAYNGVLQIRRRDTDLEWLAHMPYATSLRPSSIFERIRATRTRIAPDLSLLDREMSILDFRPGAFLKDIPIFDINPELARDAVFLSGKPTLDEDGENLPLVLNHILEDESRASQFMELLQFVTGYVESLEIETYSDLTATMRISDKYASKTSLPVSVVSAGTIQIAALIVAIYFEQSPVIIFEEPDHFIHPIIIERIAQLMRSRQNQRQFIVTTHSPVLLSQLEGATVYALYRDKDGYSHAFRPKSNEALTEFMRHDIGLDTLNESALLHE
jgi:predicted ATPase